jgi:hypothetical protein
MKLAIWTISATFSCVAMLALADIISKVRDKQ